MDRRPTHDPVPVVRSAATSHIPDLDRRTILRVAAGATLAGATLRGGGTTAHRMRQDDTVPQPLPVPEAGTPVAAGQSLAEATGADLVATIRDAPDEAMAIDALIEAFGRVAVAVYPDDPAPSAPLRAIEGTPNPLAFQRWNVEVMVRELRRDGGIVGEAFDAIVPAETLATTGAPAPSQLLAAWAIVSDRPGAGIGRAVTGELDLATAAATVYPTAVVALFAADFLQACVGDTAVGPLQPAFATLSSRSQQTACGYADQFISQVFSAVTSAIEKGAAAIGLPAFLTDILGFILNSVAAAVEFLLTPILGVIRGIGAMLAIASHLASALTMWSVQLTPDPAVTKFGLDGAGVYGKVLLSVKGLDVPTWPPIMVECAKLADVTLPDDSGAGAGVTFKDNQKPRPLVIPGPSPSALDAQGGALWDYVTESEPAAWAANGPERIGVLGITATVTREDLEAIRDALVGALYSALPPFVRDVVVALLGGAVHTLSQKLIDLATVSGYCQVTVIYHDEPVTPTEGPATEDADAASTGDCWVGTWNVANFEALMLSVLTQGGTGGLVVNSITGAMTIQFTADGTMTVTYIDATVVTDASGIAVSVVANGSVSGPYTVAGSSISATFDPASLTLTMVVSYGGNALELPPDELMGFFGAGFGVLEILSCGGDAMSLSAPGGMVYELVRLA
jgi:hypothetical protein